MITPDMHPGVEIATSFAVRLEPRVAKIRHRWCMVCDSAHEKDSRAYCHVGCTDGAICWAHAMAKLPVNYVAGICLHEMSHLLAGWKGDNEFDDEADADTKMLEVFGVEIEYRGEDEIEWVDVELLK